MLLAVDIGNSNIKFGVFDLERLVSKFSIPTSSKVSADDLMPMIDAQLPISVAMVCSVVPEKEKALSEILHNALGIDPVIVTNDLDFGLTIDYKPLSSLGTDRLVNAFAAAEKYGAPCIVCSVGTATTFDAVNKERRLLGGVIAPGMGMMGKALHLNTAQLPDIDIENPVSLLGNTTTASIRSGIFYGHAAMIEGMIEKIKKEMDDTPRVVATGGFAPLMAENTTLIDTVDENLLLDGLRLLRERIQPA